MSVLVANALINSSLDYFNSLFRGLSVPRKLQCIQNSAAHIVTNNRKFFRITPVLKNYTGCLIHAVQHLKLPLLFTKSFILVFHSVLILTCSYTNVGTILEAVKNDEVHSPQLGFLKES